MKCIVEADLFALSSFYRQRNWNPERLLVNLSKAICLPNPFISPAPSCLSGFSSSHQVFHLPCVIQLFFWVPFIKVSSMWKELHGAATTHSFSSHLSSLWNRHFLFSVCISLSLSLLCLFFPPPITSLKIPLVRIFSCSSGSPWNSELLILFFPG